MQTAVTNIVKLQYYIAICKAHLLAAKTDAVRKAFQETLTELKRMGGYTVDE